MFANRWLSTLSLLLALASTATAQERALLKRATSPFASMQPSEVSVNDSFTTGTELTIPGTASTKLGRIALGDGSGGHDWNDSDAFAGRLGADDTATSTSMPAFSTVQAGLDAVRQIYSVEPAGGELRIGGGVRIDDNEKGLVLAPIGSQGTAIGFTSINVTPFTPDVDVYGFPASYGENGYTVTWRLYPGRFFVEQTYFMFPASISHTFTPSDFDGAPYALVSLSWAAEENATEYLISRDNTWVACDADMPFTYITQVSSPTTSLVDENKASDFDTEGRFWGTSSGAYNTRCGTDVHDTPFATIKAGETTSNPVYTLGNEGTLAVTTDITDLSSPPSIGNVVPNTGNFSSLASTFSNGLTAIKGLYLSNTYSAASSGATSSVVFQHMNSAGTMFTGARITSYVSDNTALDESVDLAFLTVGPESDSTAPSNPTEIYNRTATPLYIDGGEGVVSIKSGVIHQGHGDPPSGRIRLKTTYIGNTNRDVEFQDAAGTIALTAQLPVPANPSVTVNGTAVNGSADTFMRSDAAPALADPFTPADGTQDVTGALTASGNITSTSGDLSVTSGAITAGDSSGVPAVIVTDTTATTPAENIVVNKQGGNMRAIYATYSDTGTHVPRFLIRHARGTIASPTSIQNGDQTGAFWFNAYDSTLLPGDPWRNTAVIASFAESNGGTDGSLKLYTNNTGTSTLALTIDKTQDLYATQDVNVAVNLDVNGNADVAGTSKLTGVVTFGGGITRAAATGYIHATDDYLTAFGYSAGNGSTGYGNVAIGPRALDAGATGGNNIAIGTYSLTALTSGADNTATGRGSLGAVTTGSHNTGYGKDSGVSTTSGYRNTFIGRSSGDDNVTGSDNTLIGYGSDAGSSTARYRTALGALATPDADYQIMLGTSSVHTKSKSYITTDEGYKVDGSTRIDGNGFFVPKSSADASAPNNSIYYSTDASKLVYKDSGGSVNALY